MIQIQVPVCKQFCKRIYVFLIISTIYRCSIASTTIEYNNGRVPPKLNRRNHDYSDGSTGDNDDDPSRPNDPNIGGIGDSIKPGIIDPNRVTARGGEILVPKAFPISPQEPTCEQLRAMWIFSKRQSRAAEMTNEIPTYRDPFAYNIWDPYYSTTRSLGAVRMLPHFGDRLRLPVFGRVVNREPMLPRVPLGQHQRHNGETNPLSRIYGAETKPSTGSAVFRRPPSSYRSVSPSNADGYSYGHSGLSGSIANPNAVPVQGSFQKLKELIWTERAKELNQQRRAEEMAARAAVLKEIANGQIIHSSLPYKSSPKSESALMDENRTPDREDTYQQDRVSIVASQLDENKMNNNNNKMNNNNSNNYKNRSSKSSTRSLNNRKEQKSLHSSIFSGNRATNPRNVERFGFAQDSSSEIDKMASGSGNLGHMKTSPLRPSHFRERNRSLFKQNAGNDYFQRNIRFNQNSIDERTNAVLYSNYLDQLLRTVHQVQRLPNYFAISMFDSDPKLARKNNNVDDLLYADNEDLQTNGNRVDIDVDVDADAVADTYDNINSARNSLYDTFEGPIQY